MLTIGIIGANGQVGSEVSLYLSRMDGVRVVPIVRTRYGAAFLRRCGLDCRIGSIDSPHAAKELLADCHLVVDFTFPKGMAFQMRSASRAILSSAIAHAQPGAPFVYASSYMAFGMRSDNPLMRAYTFSHTTYGAMKRDCEHFATQECSRAGRDLYVLRLGQVHGEIQTITYKGVAGFKDRVATFPATAHDIVFAYSIAEALRNIAQGKERPGQYTLLSEPAWTWSELYTYYARQAGLEPRLEIRPDPTAPTRWQRAREFVRSCTVAPLLAFARTHREWLTAYVLIHWPRFEARLKATYSVSNARREIAEFCEAERFKPFDTPIGRVPGERLRSLSDSRVTMPPAALAVRQIVSEASRQSIKKP